MAPVSPARCVHLDRNRGHGCRRHPAPGGGHRKSGAGARQRGLCRPRSPRRACHPGEARGSITRMKVDAPLLTTDLAEVPAEVREIERLGHDGLLTFEGPSDPFLPLALAAEHSVRLELATGVAIAFPRSPMQLAYTAHDLQRVSQGRLIVGLGSQVKAHVEKRYG